MSRNEEFSTGSDASDPDPSGVWDDSRFGMPLFHGTRAEFQPGDIVTPLKPKKVAFAAKNVNIAKDFAQPRGNDTRKPRLYEVEPVNHESTWSGPMKYAPYGTEETMSKDGFRVVAEIPINRIPRKQIKERQEAAEQRAMQWAQANNASWCWDCRAYHTEEAGKKYHS